MEQHLPADAAAASRRLQQLVDLSRHLCEAPLEPGLVLQVIAQQISTILGDGSGVRLLSEDGQRLLVAAFHHVNSDRIPIMEDLLQTVSRDIDKGIMRRILQDSGSVLIPILSHVSADAEQDPLVSRFLSAGIHSIIGTPLRSRGVVLGSIGVFRDQTADAYTESDLLFLQDLADRAALAVENARLFASLRESHDQLEIRVAQRTAALEAELAERARLEDALRDAVKVAEHASQARSDFLSRMSHELRTPLNAILGFVQVLQMEDPRSDQIDALGHILKGGRHLLALINEVLDIARIDAGQLALSPEPVLVKQLLIDVVELLRPLAGERVITITMALDAIDDQMVIVDRQRLTQVLLNILSNAIKYNRHYGQIHLMGHLLDDNWLRVCVTDTGIGIPMSRMGDLFAPFERIGAEHTLVEGTGLGLALSKRLMELMGGAIHVNSETGEGSTFMLDFVRSHQEVDAVLPASMPSRHGSAPAPNSVPILLIEDNLSNLRLLERLLGVMPEIQLLAAMQGQRGIELARAQKPAMILLDLHLPDMGGDEVLQWLMAEEETRNIPVVIITADATMRQAERLIASGARAYLTKPLDVAAFLNLINNLLPE